MVAWLVGLEVQAQHIPNITSKAHTHTHTHTRRPNITPKSVGCSDKHERRAMMHDAAISNGHKLPPPHRTRPTFSCTRSPRCCRMQVTNHNTIGRPSSRCERTLRITNISASRGHGKLTGRSTRTPMHRIIVDVLGLKALVSAVFIRSFIPSTNERTPRNN